MALPTWLMAFDHAAIHRIAHHVLDELAVDLQIIDRQGLQIHERRQAAAEIVEREMAAARLQLAHEMDHVAQVGDGRGFGDLETQGARRRSVARSTPRSGTRENARR
jgi:hypothetical protein